MADTTFTNGVTLTDADWFNDLNRLHYTIFGDPANAAAVRSSLGLGALALLNSPITIATEQATTSGTDKDFNSIPSGVKQITIMFDGVSTNGTSNLMIQIGDSGGIENTGYTSFTGGVSNGSTGATGTSTAGFLITSTWTATRPITGAITLTLMNAATFKWVASGVVSDTVVNWNVSGIKSLSAALDRVRITSVGGSDTFDAGNVTVSYA